MKKLSTEITTKKGEIKIITVEVDDILEIEAKVVRDIFADYIGGKSLKAIAAELTEQGVIYYLDKSVWTKNLISRIIANPKYAGVDGYPAIISQTNFELANKRKSDIQSNLSYAVSGNNAALDVFSIEKQMNELKVDIQQMTELAARTEGDPERYEVELKKMFDQLVILRGKLDLAKSQASQSDSVNAEVARIMDILKQTDMNFTEFDDVTVRRLVECRCLLCLSGGTYGKKL